VDVSEFDCPTCDRTFGSSRGLGVHHASVHDERLPNRACEACGERFHSEHERAYCSDACRESSVSFAGEDNPNYGGGKDRTDCERCGETFAYYPSEKEGLYCADCVEAGGWQTTPTASGEDNPRWRGGRDTYECAVCGESVERWPADADGDAVLCSESCRSDWLSEAFTGEGHPNWAGGGVGPYGPGWAATRRAALDRDGHACVLCGRGTDAIGRNPDVHHLVPVRRFVAADDRERADAHRLGNVLALCPGCHRRVEAADGRGASYRGLPPRLGDMSDSEDTPAVVRGDDAEYEPVDAAEGLAKGVLVGEAEGAPNFAMRRFELREGAEVPPHTNAVEHVQYVLAGEYTVTIEGEAHAVEPGDSLYIPAGAVHGYANDGDREGAFLCVVPHGEDDIRLVGEAAVDAAEDGGGGDGAGAGEPAAGEAESGS